MMECIGLVSAMVARLRTSRFVRISSGMDRFLENRLEHGGIQPTRVLVVAAAVIAIDQALAARQHMFGAVCELGAGNG